jgi:hypothetical protein
LSAFILDETLHCGAVTTYFAEQIIEQGSFPQRACEQLLGGMRFATYLPQEGIEGKRELTLRAEFGILLFWFVGFIQIDPAIGATHQVMIDVGAAIAALDFIVCRGRGKAGGHGKIVSKK